MMEPNLSLQEAGGPRPPVATLSAMFDRTVAAAPDRVALRHLGVVLTYREMGRAVAALAERVAALVAPILTCATPLPSKKASRK